MHLLVQKNYTLIPNWNKLKKRLDHHIEHKEIRSASETILLQVIERVMVECAECVVSALLSVSRSREEIRLMVSMLRVTHLQITMVDLACAIEKTKHRERENRLEQINTALTSTTVRKDASAFEELKYEVRVLDLIYIYIMRYLFTIGTCFWIAFFVC